MAAMWLSSLLWALLLLQFLPQCAAQEPYYYIKPTTDTPCRANPCLTLSEYVQQSEQYLKSNATMVFLQGTHTLDNDFVVTDVASFRLLGDPTSPPEVTTQVVCSGPVGFSFDRVLQLEISGLAITGCGTYVTIRGYSSSYNCAIEASSVQQFQVHNCSLHNNVNASALLVAMSNVGIMHTYFINNSAVGFGGGVLALSSTVTIEHCSFINNSAGYYGGAVDAFYKTAIRLNGNNLFDSNQAAYGGAINAYASCTIHLAGNNLFTNNDNYESGAVYAFSSDIQVAGNVSFLYNSAQEGGGISLEYSSTLSFQPGAHARFEGNTADRGAAIHVNDLAQCEYISYLDSLTVNNDLLPYCFFYIMSPTYLPHLTFVDNSAKELGSVLYGGLLDRCKLFGYESDSSPTEIFRNISTFESNSNSTISSEPLQVCFCRNNTPDCAYEHPRLERIRGQLFTVSLAAVDQVMQMMPGTIRAELTSSSGSNARLGDFQNIMQIEGTCTDLNYSLSSVNSSEKLVLFAEGPCGSTRISARTLVVEFLPCPTGFVLSNGICTCEKRLQEYITACYVDGEIIVRRGTLWVGAVYENSTYTGLILHPNCPFDYCETNATDITLNNTDPQCAHNHSGIICGSCQSGFSIALGSSYCLANCSDAYLALILPFAALGILLVIIILLLRLTVAIGTINGLIFYANIIAANRTIFPLGDANVLVVFISWLNLDWGIETCFYNGMDAYAKTWLQFIFPFYIWTLMGVMIIASHFSRRISKFLGTNPVAVLSTLFLLSYAKVAQTVIAALSFTTLDYPNKKEVVVWLYDGNIGYFHGKHIPLVLFALLVLLLLFLPYTLLLFLGQWLQAKSDKWVLRWVTKPQVKAFIDAYHAPCTPKHRYWIGLLLIVRFALYTVFTFNVLGDPNVNLLIIASSTFGITIFAWLTGRVYEKQWLAVLESSFILNLGILAIGTYFIKLAGGNQATFVYTLVSIAFATFIGIVLYHIHFQLKSTKTGKRLLESSTSFFHGILARITLENSTDKQPQENEQGLTNDSSITSTYVELRELLLEESDTVPMPPPQHD